MRLEQVQAFLAIAQTGSFLQAAERCGVTQSTVSRQIQALEAELGASLFHRAAQAKLTVAGEQFLPRARKICQEWASARQDIADLLSGKQPELCVAAIHSICGSYLPPALQHFCREFPNVQLRVTSLGSDRALKVLKDGLVDVAIVMNNRWLVASSEIRVDVLYREPVQLLIAADHPLATLPRVPLTQACQYPQVVYKHGYGMRRLLQELFDRQSLQLSPALELNAPDAFRSIIRQGHWVALLPKSALLEAQMDPTLAIRCLEAPPDTGIELSREVAIATTSDRFNLPPIQRFWQLVREAIPGELKGGEMKGSDRSVEVKAQVQCTAVQVA